ncbi:hypothetical protein A9D12_03290 [Erythrobacter neustonensis]|uniref:Uncharacterized protein n=2 Tax=Erythrobacter neustonensis TaxID=1112 RepID=A0A192D2G2_9SPHN|nr:hypothetical protein A9D12_03290 [Erythrobacter neustonensis]
MPAKGIFVDDEDQQFAALLSTRGVLDFDYHAVAPLTDQALAIRLAQPNVVALDYRLDEVTPNVENGHTFKGSGLAQLLRDEAIVNPDHDFGIVLVSNDYKLEAYFAPDRTAHDLFDIVYAKEIVVSERARVRAELCALSNGYQFLRELNKKYDPVVLLSASEAEVDRVRIQSIASVLSDASAPHLAAKFVLNAIIKRPGLLLDDADAASLLGLKIDSFFKLVPALTADDLLYTGIFSEGWRRWWANRLEEWGENITGKPLLDLTAQQRAEALSVRFGEALEPAASPWNHSSDEYVGFACCSCRRPTELRHSLAVFESRAPRFAARRRICWDCIQTDRYLNDGHPWQIEESDASLIVGIKTRQRKT